MRKIYWDRDLGYFVFSVEKRQRVGRIEVKRGDTGLFALITCEQGTQTALEPGVSTALVLRKTYGGDILANRNEFTAVTSGDKTQYEFKFPSNTPPINTALGLGTGTELAYVDCIGEIQTIEGTTVTSTATVTIRIHNDIVRGGESIPEEVISDYPAAAEILTTADLGDGVGSRLVVSLDPSTGRIRPEDLPASLAGSIRVEDETELLALEDLTDGTLAFQADEGIFLRLNGTDASSLENWDVVATASISRSAIVDFAHASTHHVGGTDPLSIGDLAPAVGTKAGLHGNSTRSGLVPPTPASGTKTLMSVDGSLQYGDPTGINAFTVVAADYVQPLSGADVNVSVLETAWMAVGGIVYVESGGFYQVVSIVSSVLVSLKNLGYPANAAPAATVLNGKKIVPSGVRGAAGADGAGVPSDATPQDLGTAAAGASTEFSRADHVHGMPSASDVGAAAAIHTHDAGDIISGVFDVARIPVLPSMVQVASSGDIDDLDSGQQSEIGQGTVVTTTDGRRWVYKGSGSKTSESSYIVLADITPSWSAIDDKPPTFTPSTHSHAISDVTDLQSNLDALSYVSINAQTGTTYTVQQSDHNKTVVLTNASAITVTLPSLTSGTRVNFKQGGAGKITFAAGSGVTIDCPAANKRTRGQSEGATVEYHTGTTPWLVGGLE